VKFVDYNEDNFYLLLLFLKMPVEGSRKSCNETAFHTMLGSSRVAAELAACPEELSSAELVAYNLCP
jgi:hypothetical protein